MPDFTYSPAPVLVESTGNFAIGATGVLRATEGGSAVQVYDLNGSPIASVVVGPKGAHQAFKADIAHGILDFGSVLLPSISNEARVAALDVQEAAEVAATSAAAASVSAAAAADAAEASRTTTDAAVAALVADGASATAAAVQDAIELAGPGAGGSGEQIIPLSRPGVLTVAGGAARLPLPAGTLLGVRAAVGVPANKPVIVDLNRNGSSAFADANNRPQIAAGTYLSGESGLNVAVADGDYLTVDVDQIGGPADITYIGGSVGTPNPPAFGTVVTSVTRPAGTATGDRHFAVVTLLVGGATGSTTEPTTAVTPPAGWTAVGAPQRNAYKATNRHSEQHLFTRVDDGTAGPFAFTVTQPTGNVYARSAIVTYRASSSLGPFAKASPALSNTTWAAPTVTSAEADSLLVTFWTNNDADFVTPTTAGMTQRITNPQFVIADEKRPTAGATGARTMTGTTSVTVGAVATSVILNADPAGAQPGADLTVAVRFRPAA